ncbi:MAG: hypothetical protein KDI36_11640 [Pseudomonadales bacterium]|nr:hypothetical protein [Pseudomonadales bacterium]
MEDITQLHIIGLDPERPPQILNYPCIYLYFQLSQQAPKEWCENLNSLVAKWTFPVEIKPEEGVFIETWVRKPEEIARQLQKIQALIPEVTGNYEELLRKQAGIKEIPGGSVEVYVSEAQRALNSIVAALKF